MATPARSTRSQSRAAARQQQGPLPATLTRHNIDYGSPGNASLNQQLEGDHDAFDTSLSGRRGHSARPRQASGESSLPRASRGGRARGAARQPTIEEESSGSEGASVRDEDLRPLSGHGTAIENAAGYEAARFSSNFSPAPSADSMSAQSERESHLRRVAQPWDITVLLNAVVDYYNNIARITKNLVAKMHVTHLLLFIVTILWLFPYAPEMPLARRGYEELRTRFVAAGRMIHHGSFYESPPTRAERLWMEFVEQARWLNSTNLPHYNVPDIQWAINVMVMERVEKLENKTRDIAVGLERAERELAAALPNMVVVNEVDGKLVIPGRMWDALQDMILGDDKIWNDFLASNSESIKEISADQHRALFDAATASQSIISADLAMEMIRKENVRMLEVLEDKGKNNRDAFKQEIYGLVEAAIDDLFGRVANGQTSVHQIDSTTRNFIIENTLMEIKQLNFFDPKHGARVDRRHSSPSSSVKQKSWLGQLYMSLAWPPHPPVMALLSWQGHSDCWCATHSTEQGSAQLGITTGHTVSPSELVIEHIPASNTLDIKSAPRQLDLWMQLKTADHAKELSHRLKQDSKNMNWLGECTTTAPGADWACIGRAKYDIHHENWVQKFPTFVNLAKYSVTGRHFIVKTKNNWGGDKTCFYRLRLHGMTHSQQQAAHDSV